MGGEDEMFLGLRHGYQEQFHIFFLSFASWFLGLYGYHDLSSPLVRLQPSGLRYPSWVMPRSDRSVGEEREPKDVSVCECPCECEF